MAPKRKVTETVENEVFVPVARKTKKEGDNVAAKVKVTKAAAGNAAKAKPIAKIAEDKKEEETDDDEINVGALTVSTIKDMLKERDLSTNGDKKVLSKRLIERLVKEKDPDYKPKPKGRFCKVCVDPPLMQKRNGVRGPFFGCANYPQCTYTENRGGMAMLPKAKWFDINAPR